MQVASQTGAPASNAPSPDERLLGESLLERWIPFYDNSPLIQGAAIIGLSMVAAAVLAFVLRRVITTWLKRTDTGCDDKVAAAVSRPIFVIVLACGIRVAVGRLGLDSVAAERIGDVLATLVVLFWLIALWSVCGLVLAALARSKFRFAAIQDHTASLFDHLMKMVAVAAYIVLRIWDKDVTGLLTAGGVFGIAVGFAARDTLANLISGIFIFADGHYKIGDFINLDSGERGMVTHIGIRSTRILTRDDVEITIPNAILGNAKIINESGGPHAKYRLRIKVGVAYGSDIDRVRSLLQEIAGNETRICGEPAPRVRLRAFGASSLDFELLAWVYEPLLRGQVVDAALCTVYKRFSLECLRRRNPTADSD